MIGTMCMQCSEPIPGAKCCVLALQVPEAPTSWDDRPGYQSMQHYFTASLHLSVSEPAGNKRRAGLACPRRARSRRPRAVAPSTRLPCSAVRCGVQRWYPMLATSTP